MVKHGPIQRILTSLTLSMALCAPLAAQPAADQASPAVSSPAHDPIVARIDALINARLQEQGHQPESQCDDATFLRRVTLDLTGKNPTSGEVVAFLANTSDKKRDELIERLLTSPSCAVHLANIWSSWLLPEMQDLQFAGAGPSGLQNWLRNRFAENLRYDRLVADLLVASGSTSNGPSLFFTALEGKPEKIAAKTSRVFMGVQLDCAECHDHPFDHWKQRDFWGFAAYFAQLSTDNMRGPIQGQVMDRNEGEVKLPGSEETISPQPLVTTGQSGLASGSRRQQLTLWLTAPENPYLARAAVNRCWSLLFGRGLIEPIDDMRSIEMATHPELLRDLSQHFASSNYNLRELLRALVSTQAYGRRSLPSDSTERETTETGNYAAMPIKPLTSTQLANCLQQVARDITGEQGRAQAVGVAAQLGKLRGDHSAATLGIVQALVTLHSRQLNNVHRDGTSRLLQALSAPHLNNEKRVEWMFVSTLCRKPTQEETDAILDIHRDSSTSWQADLLWALVNSTEFAMTP